mgnify:CR=1 FL=1
MDGIGDIAGFLKSIWYEKYAPLIIVLFYGLVLVLIGFADFYRIITLTIILILVLICWCFSYKLPVCPNGKIGILFALGTENLNQKNTLKSKLFNIYEGLLANSKYYSDFKVIYLKAHHVNNINVNKMKNPSYAEKILLKTKTRLCIFGSCISGNIKEFENMTIELNGVVLHKPIPDKLRQQLSTEFGSLLSQKNYIPNNDDILHFEILSEQLELTTKYIIGIAFFLSEYLVLAKNIFEDISLELSKEKRNISVINLIKSRNPVRLYEVYRALAAIYYEQYRVNKDINLLRIMDDYLERMNNQIPDTYDYHLNKALYCFLTERNIKKAKEHVKQCKGNSDAGWRYSDAFLDTYQGKLLSAYSKYCKAFKYGYNIISIFNIEEFIKDILEIEAGKFNLYFALGLINYYYKRDLVLAYSDFKKFIESTVDCCPEQISIIVSEIMTKILDCDDYLITVEQVASA